MIQAVRDILKDGSIRVAYLMCLMLGVAYGIVMAIVAVYLNKERGIDEQTIGGLAFFFSVGIAVFAVPMGALVRVLSPRVMLAVALVGYGVATAVFPFLGTEVAWMPLIVKQDEAPYPIHIHRFGADRIMAQTNLMANNIQKAWRLKRCWRSSVSTTGIKAWQA